MKKYQLASKLHSMFLPKGGGLHTNMEELKRDRQEEELKKEKKEKERLEKIEKEKERQREKERQIEEEKLAKEKAKLDREKAKQEKEARDKLKKEREEERVSVEGGATTLLAGRDVLFPFHSFFLFFPISFSFSFIF